MYSCVFVHTVWRNSHSTRSSRSDAFDVDQRGDEIGFATPGRRVAPEHRGRAGRGDRVLDDPVEDPPALGGSASSAGPAHKWRTARRPRR